MDHHLQVKRLCLSLAIVAGLFTIADAQTRLRVRMKSIIPTSGGGDPLNTASDNANYDALCARADVLFCVDFRSDSDNGTYDFITPGLTPGPSADASYDSAADMGLMTWDTDEVSSENIRVGLGNGLPARSGGTNLPHPVSGTQKVLFQIDNKWDESWFTEFLQPGGSEMGGWKWLQITDNGIMIESQMLNVGDETSSFIVPGEMPLPLAWLNVRAYNIPVPPSANEPTANGTFCGVQLGSDAIGPMGPATCWKFYANRRTRIWIEMIHVAGETYDGGTGAKPYAHFNMWLADEQQAPQKVLSDITHTCDAGFHEEFWVEYDTSRPERDGGVMKAWYANLVVLKDYSVDPETLMEKPVGLPHYAQTFNDLTTGVLYGQDSWTAFSSGQTRYTVQTSTMFEGAKGLEVGVLDTHATITRVFPSSLTRGSAFVRMRKSHNSGNSHATIRLKDTGDSPRIIIRMGPDGFFSGYDNGSYTQLQTYAADTWYWVHIEWNQNNQANKFRFRVIGSTGVPVWSSWLTVNGGTTSNINAVELDAEGDGSTSTHKAWYDALYIYSSHSVY